MKLRSTTLRLAAIVFLFQLVAAVVLLVGIGAVLRGQSAATATRTAEAIRSDLTAAYAQGGAPMLTRAIELRVRPSAVLLLVDADGRRLAGNLGAWPGVPIPHGRYREVALQRLGLPGTEASLVRQMPLRGGERLLIGVTVEGERQLLRTLERASFAALLLAFGFAMLAAWIAARLIVGRLGTVVATLRSVREGRLAERTPPDRSNDAFAALGREVDATLDRLQGLIGELQIATDGLAHDLRSPLTRLRAALDQAGRSVDGEAASTAIDRALAENDRLRTLVDTALLISRAEAGIGREQFEPLDLADLVRVTAEMFEPLAEEGGRTIGVAAPATLVWPAHRQLIAQALANLVDNALNHGSGAITIAVSALDDRGAAITVTDRGRGIEPARREEALRRFGRLDPARAGPGAGLGLSLVQAVAHLHGGGITLADAAPGLSVTITLR
ncbi:sensor histidine kinase [Sphingomonas sp. Y38-1Y]|uniref:sensor histidine kinase n=1 Tax=Sphingomonas sp. Y38-1Y TaxID=3078265 RepID=UPI0028E18B1F|nr:ATP-binding protein [Sphingomonas sp. Y38-1Y]